MANNDIQQGLSETNLSGTQHYVDYQMTFIEMLHEGHEAKTTNLLIHQKTPSPLNF